MFSNRRVLFYAAALSFLLIPSCSKQSDDSESKAAASGGMGPVFNNGGGNSSGSSSATGSTSSSNPFNTSPIPGGETDPTKVGSVTTLDPSQVEDISVSACNAWAVEPESSPAKLQLVVDVSSSMNSTAPGTNQSKWEVTKNALIEAICGTSASGPGLGAGLAVGLMFYPNMLNSDKAPTTPQTMDVCMNTQGTTPMAPLGNGDGSQREILRGAFTNVVLGRGTPTAGAYDYALNSIAMKTKDNFPGDLYMLLITDGMPTLYHDCYNPSGSLNNLSGDEVVAEVDAAYGQGVKTFIIGSPGSEQGLGWLSMAAYLGGTGKSGCNPNAGAAGPLCHMDMTKSTDFSTDLRNGLNDVVQVVSTGCKFNIPTESADGTQKVDPNKVSPIIQFSDGHAELAHRDNANGDNCTEGFHLISDTQMELCQDTCQRFLSDPTAKMQLIFGCTEGDITSVLQ
jgi:hypothetical protein